MAQYIDKSALVAEIERRAVEAGLHDGVIAETREDECYSILSFLDTLEVKEVDLELITGWFDHIAQIADDRMTLTNQRMTDAHALDEIKCLAKNSSEFITKHYKVQKGEVV